MKSKPSLIVIVQIIGLMVSIATSIILIFVQQVDPVLSVLLGLAVVILTQLIDLQLRHSDSEKRILHANALNQELYRDEQLLKQIQQIVNDYYMIKSGWFDLFKLRADDSINECRNILHKMVEGEMEVPPRSPFTFAFEGIKRAKKTIKGVTVDNLSYWRSIESEKYLQANAEAVQRGIHFIRVFVHPRENIREITDVLEKHKQKGVDVYIVYTEDLPKDLAENYTIMDDQLVTQLQRIGDSRARERVISINQVDVERMVKKFNMVMRYARKLEDTLAGSKS